MTIEMKVRNLNNVGYYSNENIDEFGQTDIAFIYPFTDSDGSLYYYARRNALGDIYVQGEGYFPGSDYSLKKHKMTAKYNFESHGSAVRYIWLNQDGSTTGQITYPGTIGADSTGISTHSFIRNESKGIGEAVAEEQQSMQE